MFISSHERVTIAVRIRTYDILMSNFDLFYLKPGVARSTQSSSCSYVKPSGMPSSLPKSNQPFRRGVNSGKPSVSLERRLSGQDRANCSRARRENVWSHLSHMSLHFRNKVRNHAAVRSRRVAPPSLRRDRTKPAVPEQNLSEQNYVSRVIATCHMQ